MKKSLLLVLLSFISFLAVAQIPANDNCATAQNLGTLPTPAACPSGVGANVNVAGTTIGATAPNPYTTLLNCQTGGNQPGPALDVWYSFVASGNMVVINITPGAPALPNPAITLWTGTCGNLVGFNCSNNGTAAGANTVTFQPTAPGQTYFIQISGMTAAAAGNFNLSVHAENDCNNCLQNASLSISPTPTNGTYPPNTTVNFCFTITSYTQVSANWLHGVIPTFGCGWDLPTMTFTPATSCSANGSWSWFPGGCTSSANASVWGPGFYYDYTAAPGNPGNNFGDYNASGICTWTFCWKLKTKPTCAPGCTNLNISINTTGDGESGSWTSIACLGDPNYPFAAVMSCCSSSAIATNAPCFNGVGTGSATPVTGTGPYTYTWTSAPVQNTQIANNLPAGTYTVSVKDNNGCISTSNITVTQPASINPAFTLPTPTQCLNGNSYSFVAATPGGVHSYTFNPVAGSPAAG
ncbi:MAG: hypothetical protein H0U95_03245, partial [Bacteroidetes bacterium]|nr:hypothetical protein [Bacteroidota bacterium]